MSEMQETMMQVPEEPHKADLKSERVQEERLKSERVQERLKRMPGWSQVQNGRGIKRQRDLGTAETAADYAGFVLRQAARARQAVRVEIKGPRLFLIVFSGSHAGVPSGITDNQLDFASELG